MSATYPEEGFEGPDLVRLRQRGLRHQRAQQHRQIQPALIQNMQHNTTRKYI